ncbi:MAG: hypothetical protein A2V51_00840 [Candidatus Dadabacteria bacterium RBG_19FT_COMBO_40_33]|nr:MAG: hypothetical protein A2V51_00840 [Candidatus Dadabacteria bacterium RBG_19FT_COMBO_40_33]
MESSKKTHKAVEVAKQNFYGNLAYFCENYKKWNFDNMGNSLKALWDQYQDILKVESILSKVNEEGIKKKSSRKKDKKSRL